MKTMIPRHVVNAFSFILSVLAIGCLMPKLGSQVAEVRAEQTLSVSLAALDSFVAFEHRRRSDVPPLVRDVADRVRLNAPRALDSANALRLAYKGNRNAEKKAGLLTSLAVVESLVSEIRVWVPSSASADLGAGAASPRRNGGPEINAPSATQTLIAEARASQTVTAQSWVALVPVFVDLAREVFAVVNRTREAVKQDAEWTLAEEADFAVKIAALKTAEHWRH
jgi:hypothetical protein